MQRVASTHRLLGRLIAVAPGVFELRLSEQSVNETEEHDAPALAALSACGEAVLTALAVVVLEPKEPS